MSFVCAFTEDEVRRISGLTQEYLEKFFSVSVSLIPPSPETVGRCLRTRLVESFTKQGWFGTEADSAEFGNPFQSLWEDSLARLCGNLRKAGLLSNDVAAAGQPIAGEVNALDLVGIEAIRRFCPSVYSIVRTAPST